MARFSLTRLGSNPQLVAHLPDASFDNEICIETPTHLADIHGLSLELERRRARDHLQSCYVCEQVDDFFADSVAKVLLVWIRTHVHERQYRDGCNARPNCDADLLRLIPRRCVHPPKDR